MKTSYNLSRKLLAMFFAVVFTFSMANCKSGNNKDKDNDKGNKDKMENKDKKDGGSKKGGGNE